MEVISSALANKELKDAVNFYETELSGLGIKFKHEIKETVIRVSRYPMAWPAEYGEIRKCLLHHFPYKLLYSVETDHILIIAVAH